MDELETRLTEDLRAAAEAVVAGESLDNAVEVGRRQRARRQRVLVAGAGVVAVLAVVVGVLAITGDDPTAVETVGDPYPPGEVWTTTSPAPIESRVDFVSTWTGEELLVWGGRQGDGEDLEILRDGAAYDPDTDSWRTLPDPPIPGRTNAVSAWTGEVWIIIGGMSPGVEVDTEPSTDVLAYDPDADEWRSAELPFVTFKGDGEAVATPWGVVVTGAIVESPVERASNTFLIDPSDLSFEALLPLSGWQTAAAVWPPEGAGVYVSGMADGCVHACLWELPLNPAAPTDPQALSPPALVPIVTEGAPSPVAPLLWADGLIVGFDTIYDLDTGGRPAPRRNEADLTNPVWTGDVVVGASSDLGSLGSSGGGTSDPAPGDAATARWWQYDPLSGQARDLDRPPEPGLRYGAQAVWTGGEVLVWGGTYCVESAGCAGGPDDPLTGLRLRPPPLPSPETPSSGPPSSTEASAPSATAPSATTTSTNAPTSAPSAAPATTAPPAAPDAPTLTQAGTTFGMCAVDCVNGLTLYDADVMLTTSDTMGDLMGGGGGFRGADGRLTEAGLAALRAALTPIGPDVLQETYGCPDCADGGETWVRIDHGGGARQSSYEYGNPPPELAALDEVVMSLIEALQTCVSNELITIEEPCTSLE